MLRRVAELDAPHQLPRPDRLERLIERPCMCVLRLSSTSVIRSHPALGPSSRPATSCAQSVFVRRARAVGYRHPDGGSQNRNTAAVPARSYS